MSRVWTVVWAAAFVGACTSDGEDADTDDTDGPGDTDGTDCFADPMALTPGTGDISYVPLASGDPVTIWHGPQGGWHIDTAGFVEHAPPTLSLHPKVTLVAGNVGLAGTELPVPPKDPGDVPGFVALAGYDTTACSGEFWGVRAFVDDYVIDPPESQTYQDFICSLEGQQLQIEITAADLDTGRSVTSSVLVTAQLDPVVDVPLCP